MMLFAGIFLQIPQVCPSADVCAEADVIDFFDAVVAEPLQGMAPVSVKGDFDGRRRDERDFLSVCQILQKTLCIVNI